MQFKFTSPGRPVVFRNDIDTDTILRAAFGDNARTTARLMAVNSGHPLTFTFRGVKLTVERADDTAGDALHDATRRPALADCAPEDID